MRAALLHKPYDIRIEETVDPMIGPEEVLLEHIHTGICGTDVNRYKGLRAPGTTVYPVIIGHEFAGRIAEVGEKVKSFHVGDRVLGSGEGSLRQYVPVPEAKLLRLAENVSLEEAQSISPLCGTLHAMNLSGIGIGDTVAVLGPGHAGLILVQWAKAGGADHVIMVGTRNNRLQVARSLGADFIVNTKDEDPVHQVKDITGGLGADVVFEATGRPEAIKQAVEIVRVEGTIVVFGVGQEPVDGFDIYTVYRNKIRIIGTRGRTDRERETVMRYLASGKITLKPIITHVLPLEETKRGFEIVDKRLENAIRVVIKS